MATLSDLDLAKRALIQYRRAPHEERPRYARAMALQLLAPDEITSLELRPGEQLMVERDAKRSRSTAM